MISPIERLVDASGLRCTVCGRPKGDKACHCWVTCSCGWSVQNIARSRCRNPVHEAAKRRRAKQKEAKP